MAITILGVVCSIFGLEKILYYKTIRPIATSMLLVGYRAILLCRLFTKIMQAENRDKFTWSMLRRSLSSTNIVKGEGRVKFI